MLKSMRLVNFQGHADTKVEFGSGDTVIIGSTDSGKSSIFRAFEWVRTNRPLGTSFIRKGESTCKVELEIETKSGTVIIERERGPGVNLYTVDGELLEAPGSGVPEKLQELLNMGELNIQTQLDPHFMVLDSPGKAAQTINAVTHLEEADRVIVKLISMGKENNSKISFLEQSLADLEAKRSNPVFGLLADFEATLCTAEDMEVKQKEGADQHYGIASLLDSISVLDFEVGESKSQLGCYDNLDDLAALVPDITSRLLDATKKGDTLAKIIADCVGAEHEIDGINSRVERFVGFDEVVFRVNCDIAGIGGLEKTAGVLVSVLAEIKGVDLLLGNAKKTKENLDGVWAELLGEMEVCPVCETGLDDTHRQIAVRNLK